MKLVKSKKTYDPRNEAVYQKTCSCCGRTFKATYCSTDYNLYQVAKDVVDSHYNAHKLCCLSPAEYNDITA